MNKEEQGKEAISEAAEAKQTSELSEQDLDKVAGGSMIELLVTGAMSRTCPKS